MELNNYKTTYSVFEVIGKAIKLQIIINIGNNTTANIKIQVLFINMDYFAFATINWCDFFSFKNRLTLADPEIQRIAVLHQC